MEKSLSFLQNLEKQDFKNNLQLLHNQPKLCFYRSAHYLHRQARNTNCVRHNFSSRMVSFVEFFDHKGNYYNNQ